MVCGHDLSPIGDQGSLARSNVNGFPAAPGAKSKKQGKTEKDNGRRPDGNRRWGDRMASEATLRDLHRVRGCRTASTPNPHVRSADGAARALSVVSHGP
jgi:hypothetical protein